MPKQPVQPFVLMYHGIIARDSLLPHDREVGVEWYDVSVADFRAQMEWLKNHAYRVRTIEGEMAAEKKDIVLTFDNGEMNSFDQALPILREYGFSACFFIIVKMVGRQGYMGWPEIKKLHEAGMTVGSHGLSHETLTNLLDTQIAEELKASRRTMETNLGITIDSLSVPGGFCSDKVIQMAYETGYKTIFIYRRPRNLQSDCLSRVAVRGNWTLPRFEQAMARHVPLTGVIAEAAKNSAKFVLRESGYNWVRNVLIKIGKS